MKTIFTGCPGATAKSLTVKSIRSGTQAMSIRFRSVWHQTWRLRRGPRFTYCPSPGGLLQDRGNSILRFILPEWSQRSGSEGAGDGIADGSFPGMPEHIEHRFEGRLRSDMAGGDGGLHPDNPLRIVGRRLQQGRKVGELCMPVPELVDGGLTAWWSSQVSSSRSRSGRLSRIVRKVHTASS